MGTENNFSKHSGFRRTFKKDHLTLGIFFPIEASYADLPRMQNQLELARVADEAGYAALWARDDPLRDPHFVDIGQTYDTWVFTAYVVAAVRRIAVGTGSVILPLRAAIDLAKARYSVDVLSGGRFLFGVASGDRPVGFPLYGYEHAPLRTSGEHVAKSAVSSRSASCLIDSPGHLTSESSSAKAPPSVGS
jgi:luciferase-type oxidoreductase